MGEIRPKTCEGVGITWVSAQVPRPEGGSAKGTTMTPWACVESMSLK